jgi:hypothetical protein
LPGLLLWGTQPGSILLGLAFSVHASAAVDIVLMGVYGVAVRIASTCFVALALALGLYLPVGWVLTRVASPQTLQIDAGPFETDDVILMNRWAYLYSPPKVGDVVMYWGPGTGTFRGARGNMRVAEGDRIDRILAGPGSEVVWDNGQLFVDGKPSPWQPLNSKVPTTMPLKTTVPPDCYFIMPSTLGANLQTANWRALCSVPTLRIHGKAYLRLHPLSRLARVR